MGDYPREREREQAKREEDSERCAATGFMAAKPDNAWDILLDKFYYNTIARYTNTNTNAIYTGKQICGIVSVRLTAFDNLRYKLIRR